MVTPLIVVVLSVLPDAGAAACDGVLPEPPASELPHAAAVSAAASRTVGASQLNRLGCLPAPGVARRRPHRVASRRRPSREVCCCITVLLLLSGLLFGARAAAGRRWRRVGRGRCARRFRRRGGSGVI